jgi:hypothetical protein
MSFPYARSAACALGLGALLALGACSRSEHLTAGLTGPGRPGTGRQAGAGCPTLVGNDINTAFAFIHESGSVVQFRPTKPRLRMQVIGDAAEVSILDCGPCAATDIPNLTFVSGHANVFLHGSNQSLTTNGQRLTFGPLLPLGAAEPGIVIANDAQGNVLEIIWPELAGIGTGAPIVRVELVQWNFAMTNPGTSVDLTFDLTAEQDGVLTTFKGGCDGMAMDGTIVTGTGGGANLHPCPASLRGVGGSANVSSAACVQFRSRRARFEAIGDLPSHILDAIGFCAASDNPSIRFTGGTGNVRQSGQSTSVTATGKPLTFAPLVSPGVAIEPGVVLATDLSGNVLEIIWPGLAGLPAGPPILRLQLAQWSTWVRTGRNVDMDVTVDAVDGAGNKATFTATAREITIPQMK